MQALTFWARLAVSVHGPTKSIYLRVISVSVWHEVVTPDELEKISSVQDEQNWY